MSESVSLHLQDGFKTDAQIRDFSFVFDEPEDKGGKNQGPTPTEMVCAALGACTSITLKMYANRKQWQIDNIEVEVTLSEEKEFRRKISLTATLDEKQKERLLSVANACPVHKLISEGQKVTTELI